jgi:hypothetical protein
MSLVFGPAVVACSSTARGGSGAAPGASAGVDAGEPAFVDEAAPNDPTYTPSEIWADDPPPKWCGPAGGAKPPPIPGGTPECPDDKNREGCPCKKLGEKASCWPGARANRNLGICSDGTTTCESHGELQLAWGKCEGYVLPAKGATAGKQACKCFSAGAWKIDNLQPCFVTSSTGNYATSASCDPNGPIPPHAPPSTPWSPNTVTVDCAGHFKLCYSLKAGDAKNPKPTDCSLMTVCTEDDYVDANKPQNFPELPAWSSTNATCVDQMIDGSPIYGEMTVQGKSVLCDEISDGGKPLVFNRVQYCPMDCASRPTDPDCSKCGSSGGGQF